MSSVEQGPSHVPSGQSCSEGILWPVIGEQLLSAYNFMNFLQVESLSFLEKPHWGASPSESLL